MKVYCPPSLTSYQVLVVSLQTLCEAVRKQKELQLELLYTGLVESWSSFEQRGRILYVGAVPVTCDGVCDDRYVNGYDSLGLIFLQLVVFVFVPGVLRCSRRC